MIDPAKLLKILETRAPDDPRSKLAHLARAVFRPNPRQILLDDDEKNFVLNFPYNADTIYEIKAHFPPALRRWDAENKRWLVSVTMESMEPLMLLAGAWEFTFRPSAYEKAKALLEDIHFFKSTSAALDTGYEPLRQDGKPFVNAQGKPLHPFQKTGVGYAVRSKRCIVGDEQGLGKSVQALAGVEVLDAYPCVIFCRESLVYQWEDEVRSWLPHRTVEVIDNASVPTYRADIEIIARSNLKLPASWYQEKNRFIPKILTKKWFKDHYTSLQGRQNKSMIIDEIQDYKNRKSQRGEAITEFANGRPFGDPIDVRFVLTGTIIENRPAELLQPLRIIDRLDDLGGFWLFVNAYCDAEQTDYGLNIKGAKLENLKTLNEKLRSICYIRRDKKQVMPELPAIQPVRIRLPISNQRAYERAEQGFAEYLDGVERETPQTFINELSRIERLRQLAVEGIMGGVEEWLEAFVETDQKLLIFAHHINIQEKLADMANRILAPRSKRAAVLFAGSAKEQERNKKLFQTDPDCQILVGSMEVGGTGHNLTAASNVALIELPWTPSTIDQILARAYGRLSDAHGIDCYFLNGRNTIHDEIWAVLEEKRAVTTAVISGKEPETKVTQQIQREVIERFRKRARKQRAA